MRAHSLASIHLIPGIVVSDPEIHHGEPVFANTKVPVQTLLDYRAGQSPLYEFMLDFPEVLREQVKTFLNRWAEEEKAGAKDAQAWLIALGNQKRAEQGK